MAQVLSRLTRLPSSKWVTIGILVVTCIIYTYALVHGMKGISRLSAACMYLFFALLAMCSWPEARPATSWRPASLPSEIWPRTSLAWPPSPIPSGPPPSPRPGPSFTGLLDGMVRGLSLLHRLHLPWAHREADHPGRLCIQPGRHLLKLPDPGKLQPGPPVSGKLDVLGIYGGAGDLYSTIIAIVDTLPLLPWCWCF